MFFKTGAWKNRRPSGKKGHQRAIAPSLGPPRVPTMMALFLYGQSMMALEGNRSTNCPPFWRSGRTQGGGQLVGHQRAIINCPRGPSLAERALRELCPTVPLAPLRARLRLLTRWLMHNHWHRQAWANEEGALHRMKTILFISQSRGNSRYRPVEHAGTQANNIG